MLSEEEKQAIEHLTKKMKYHKDNPLDTYVWLTLDEHYVRIILNLIEKQSKEIEELKDMNERQKYRIELVSEDKIEERADNIDESTMLKQIKLKLQEKNIPIETLLAEFERLEDRKVQIEYNNVFNKGVKSVEDKIKAKIEELEKLDFGTDLVSQFTANLTTITILQSLLEKE